MSRRFHGQLRDGWVSFTGLSGWESHEVSVKVAVIDGRPLVTSLHIDLRKDVPESESGITGQRARTLPLLDLAKVALSSQSFVLMPDLPRAISNVARARPPKHDKRAVITKEQVAKAYLLYVNAGHTDVREQVCRRLHISPSTYDRYIRRAEAAGDIPKRKGSKK